MIKQLIRNVIQKLTGSESLPISPKYPFSTIGNMSLTNEDPKKIKTLLDLTKKLHDVLVIYNAAGYAMKWKTDKVDRLLSQSQDLIKQFEQIETTEPPTIESSVAWGDLLKEADQIVRSKSVYKKFIDGTPLANDIAVWMTAFAQDVARRDAQQPATIVLPLGGYSVPGISGTLYTAEQMRDYASKAAREALVGHHTSLHNHATSLLFALQDAWPYVNEHCTIDSKRKSISALLRKHGEFADTDSKPPFDAQEGRHIKQVMSDANDKRIDAIKGVQQDSVPMSKYVSLEGERDLLVSGIVGQTASLINGNETLLGWTGIKAMNERLKCDQGVKFIVIAEEGAITQEDKMNMLHSGIADVFFVKRPLPKNITEETKLDVIVVRNIGIPNKNGITYTHENFKPFLGKSYYGQIGFPEYKDNIENLSTIDVQKASHQIQNIRIVDGNVVGTLKILDTPNGNILRNLIKQNNWSGFAMRSIVLKRDSEVEVIEIVAFDYVSDPA